MIFNFNTLKSWAQSALAAGVFLGFITVPPAFSASDFGVNPGEPRPVTAGTCVPDRMVAELKQLYTALKYDQCLLDNRSLTDREALNLRMERRLAILNSEPTVSQIKARLAAIK